MPNRRILELFPLFRQLSKNNIAKLTDEEIIILIEFIHNLVKNKKILITRKEKRVLIRQKEILILLSKTRNIETARILLKELSLETIKVLKSIHRHIAETG